WLKTNLIADCTVRKLSMNPRQSGEIWAVSGVMLGAARGMVYVTTDAGATWHHWDIGWYLDEILVHPQYSQTVFAAGERGIIRKQDGPATATGWSPLKPQERCRSLCIPPAQPDTIYAGLSNKTAKSADRGSTWTYYPSANNFMSLAAAPDTAGLLYGGDSNRGIFKSTDAAASWKEINTGIQANQIYSIAVSPVNAGTLLAGTLAGLYLRNQTLQWDLINDGRSEAVSFHPLYEDILYAGFDREFGASADRGRTWSYSPLSARSETHDVSSIAVSLLDPALVLAGIYFYAGDRGEIIRSTDGGASFDSVWQSSVSVNAVVIHPADPQIMFAGTGSFYAPVLPGGLFTSTDGGASWIPTSLQNVVVNSIVISPSDPNLIYAGCGGSDCAYAGIFKSTDGGATWKKTVSGLPAEYAITALQIDAKNDAVLYAASFYGGIFATLNRGDYWTLIGLADYLVYDVVQLDNAAGLRSLRLQAAQQPVVPSATIVAGTTSGLYQYSAAGSGIVTGTITAEDTGKPVDAAQVSSSCGSTCVSAEGYYLLLMPSGTHTVDISAEGYYAATIAGVQVLAGGSMVRNISLEPRKDSGSCPAAALLSNMPGRRYLAVLRRFRDGVLDKSRDGQELIALYYARGPSLINVLEKRQDLRARCLSLLTQCLPALEAALSGQALSLSPALADDISSLLTAIEQVSPAETRAAIDKLRRYLHDRTALIFFQD
ncbi:MAG: carboxypeptidase regulatory-like domain-containing protein, partial [Proteobacteria bacterium]|nr:carboxypeptidase regulatory-like domain-containing protein [Pseudomonadota bacterium]